MIASKELHQFLERKYQEYNVYGFIENDPISIPHRFSKKQDIEISAFFAAVLAWGQRKTIINKCNLLISLMDDAPHDFLINAQESDWKRFVDFKHRTFNATDCLYFLTFLKQWYTQNQSLEQAFVGSAFESVESSLILFSKNFFGLPDFPPRTRKHIQTPQRKSACKRLNMFLRWMVREDKTGVDFGIWNNINAAHLSCPLDVHSGNVARKLGLLQRKQNDATAVAELDFNLRKLDAKDPVKYDFALFGLGVFEGF